MLRLSRSLLAARVLSGALLHHARQVARTRAAGRRHRRSLGRAARRRSRRPDGVHGLAVEPRIGLRRLRAAPEAAPARPPAWNGPCAPRRRARSRRAPRWRRFGAAERWLRWPPMYSIGICIGMCRCSHTFSAEKSCFCMSFIMHNRRWVQTRRPSAVLHANMTPDTQGRAVPSIQYKYGRWTSSAAALPLRLSSGTLSTRSGSRSLRECRLDLARLLPSAHISRS